MIDQEQGGGVQWVDREQLAPPSTQQHGLPTCPDCGSWALDSLCPNDFHTERPADYRPGEVQ